MNEKKLTLSYELELTKGRRCAGMDEAGRGPLAGPVVAACVIMPEEIIPGIDDSKKLSAKKREVLYEEIMSKAVAVGVGMRDAEMIDQINILNATREAMREAYTNLGVQPEILLVDSVKGLNLNVETIPMDHGDALCYSIAAASIIAKVTRDRLMDQMDAQYSAYGFKKHKGYGTAQHIRALEEAGPSPIHRKSFIKNLKPTAAALGEQGEALTEVILKASGFKILERNYRIRGGECDLIALDEGVLTFVEVKTRSAESLSTPAEAVDERKQQLMERTAAAYLAEKQLDYPCRYDVAEVVVSKQQKEVIYHKNVIKVGEGSYFA